MTDIVKRIEELMDLFDEGEVTTANKIQRPSDPFREFEERNPQADGGRIPFRRGGTDPKTGMGFQKGNIGFTKKGVIKNPTGKNQYGSIRTLEEVQKAIDNAPPVLKKGKSVERNPKDLLAESSYVKKKEGGTQYITRKEYDEYKNKLKFKTTGRESFVKETRKKAAKKRSNLTKTKSSLSLETELAAPKKTGLNFHHAGFKESLTNLKNTMYIPGSSNRKMAKLFEDPLIKEMESFTKVFDDVDASPLEKQKAATNYLKNDRALRQKYPEFKNFKTRFSFRRTAFEPGIMVKEKLPDPSLAISQEPGMTLKGETPSTPKGKQILKFAKADLNRLAAIGCPGKMMGGRVKLAKGENLSRCAVRGINKLKSTDPKNLTLADRANYQAIRKSSQGARILKNVLGPAALAIEALFAAPFAAFDYASGRRGKDIALSALSLGFADAKLTRDELKERFPEYGQAQKIIDLDNKLLDLESKLDTGSYRGRAQNRFLIEKLTKDFDDAIKKLPTEESFLKNIRLSEQAEQDVQADREILKKQRRPSFDLSDPFSAAGGGIAKLAGVDSGPPPPAGPNSQGLQGLMKRVKKL